MVRYMMRYIVRYTESQFLPSELFIMITDITAPANILLMSNINIFPGDKWWWTKQYELRPFIMFLVLCLFLCLDNNYILSTAEISMEIITKFVLLPDFVESQSTYTMIDRRINASL